MKKIFSLITMLMLASMSFVVAGPSVQIPLIGGGGGPIYTESQFVPLIFLHDDGGRILSNEAYWNLPGENGNLEIRDNNYIFTGEAITWKFLVFDKNGVPEKILDVYSGWILQENGPLDPEIQANCHYIGEIGVGSLIDQGYSNVRRPGDQEPQLNGNPATMGEYECTLTIEPTCHGQKWMSAKVVDLDGNSDTTRAESWFCNPSLDLYVSGSIDFGELGPAEQGSSTFSVENTGEVGSGVEVVLSIAGTDFYDPSSSGAMCPTTNQLSLIGDNTGFTHGFWYSAIMGSHSTNDFGNYDGKKRIPYGNSIGESDPIFSRSDELDSWSEWKSQHLVPMSPGSEATVTLTLGLPGNCNGEFIDGSIDLFAWAI